MHLHEQIYSWLVNKQFIPNEGQIDHNGQVSLPPKQSDALESGYLIGKIIQKIAAETNVTLPKVFASMKSDLSKSTKTNNWNLVWLTFSSIGLKFDLRIKELILKGQSSLIVEVLKQLYEHDTSPKSNEKFPIKQKNVNKAKHNNPVDIKNINTNKDPQFCQNSLEFLILILKTSLSINAEEILGLLTNQYKFLAQIIVKGVNQNFDPIILFYSLLNKYKDKLNQLMQNNQLNQQAFLLAFKPGFVSKNQKVAELTIQLFGKLRNIFNSFIKLQTKCLHSFLLGIKRHSTLRYKYWELLCQIIYDREVEFFSEYYFKSFQNPTEIVQITSFIIEFIPGSSFKSKLVDEEIVLSWINETKSFPQNDIDAQITAIKFIGNIMLYLPQTIESNQWVFGILTRNWQKRSLGSFSILFNELIQLLQQLGRKKNPLAKRIYLEIIQIAKRVSGDKREYLIQNFIPIVTQFTSIPCQKMINQLKNEQFSTSEFNLVCESIENTENTVSLIEIFKHLKDIFLANKIVNFYCIVLFKEIIEKLIQKQQDIKNLVLPLLDETLHQYGLLETKYKSKPIEKPTISFGSSSRVQITSKENNQELIIKQNEKKMCLILIKNLVNYIFDSKNDIARNQACNSIIKTNVFIKNHNNKTGSKQLKNLLVKKFKMAQQKLNQYQSSQLKIEPVTIKNSKIQLTTSPTTEEIRLKQYQLQYKEEMQQFVTKRKKAKENVSLINLSKGIVTQCQIAEFGSLQSIVHPAKQINIISKDQLDPNQLEIIQSILKKYHKVLSHLFWLYADTLYSPDNVEIIEDNIKRKEILSVAELTKLLKDYKKFYLTSQTEISHTVREINLKLQGKRSINQLDFEGFYLYIVQFCFNNMTIPHQITTTTTTARSNAKIIGTEKQKKLKMLKNEPIQVIMEEFFAQLKQTFKSKKQNIALFQAFQDIQLTKDQIQTINEINTNLSTNSSYILPSGYKKIPQYKFQYFHQIKNPFPKISQPYEIAIDALQHIFSNSQLRIHLIESIFEKKTIFKAKPVTYILKGQQTIKKRAMSTNLNKNPSILAGTQSIHSKGVFQKLKQLPPENQEIGQSVAQVLENMLQTLSKKKVKETIKISEPKKRAISTSKILEINKKREQLQQKKRRQKQQKQQESNKKLKQEQQKKRQKLDLFLENQRLKLMQKKRQEQQKKQAEQREIQKQKLLAKEKNEKFKSFNSDQIKKIKQIEINAITKITNQKQQLILKEENMKKQSLIRKQKIQSETKNIIESRKQVQQNFANLLRSEPIKETYKQYDPNIKAIFQFIVNSTTKTIKSNEQKEQISFDGWKRFMKIFDLSPIFVQPNDVVIIFKILTKNKLVAKQQSAGLNYEEFKEALFEIAARYKGFFNFIHSKIQTDKNQNGQLEKNEEQALHNNGILKKQQQPNEFQRNTEIDLDKLMNENNDGKSQLNQYGDLSQVSSHTLKGLIYYLKVPNNRQGQIERFKVLNLEKRLGSLTIEKRLKEKLSQDYTLNFSQKSKKVAIKRNNQIKKAEN